MASIGFVPEGVCVSAGIWGMGAEATCGGVEAHAERNSDKAPHSKLRMVVKVEISPCLLSDANGKDKYGQVLPASL
jgi:hypothetical protein